MVIVIVGGVALLVAIWVVAVFNRLVTLRNRLRNAFSQIDVQLKRRHDLIPNLVETTKAYLTHERETLEAVVEARGAAEAARTTAARDPSDAGAMDGLAAAETRLTNRLGKLIAVVEAYPELKANQSISELFEALASTENRVAFSRQAYNDAVMHFNTAAEVFPASLVAGMLGFQRAAYFELEDAAERALPEVRLE